MLTGASATLLLTLAARAAASRVVPDVAFQDDCAGRIARQSPYALDGYAQDPGFVRGVVLRSAIMDDMARDFFTRHPDGLAVSLGAGLCTRRQRLIASGAIAVNQTWLHVDLPDVIALRQSLMALAPGEHNIACSLLDEATWLQALPPDLPTLFILEGVCPYLPESPLRAWFTRLGEYSHAMAAPHELALDFVDPELVRIPTQVGSMNLPLQSGFTSMGEVTHLHAGMRAISVHHPFARFSPGHAQFEADIQARTGRPLYTIAHMALNSTDGPH